MRDRKLGMRILQHGHSGGECHGKSVETIGEDSGLMQRILQHNKIIILGFLRAPNLGHLRCLQQ